MSAATDEATLVHAEAAVRLLTTSGRVESQHGEHRLGAHQLLSLLDSAMHGRSDLVVMEVALRQPSPARVQL